MVKRRTRNEKIAIAMGFLSLLVFLPVFYSIFQTNSPGYLNAYSGENYTYDTYNIRNDAILDLKSQDLVTGLGEEASFGDTLYLHYVVQLENGDTIDSSSDSPTPFMVTLGSGDIIAGLDIGLVGMREGGIRRLTIPPELAHGSREVVTPDGYEFIPRNATLIFDIVLLKVQKYE